MVERVVRHSGSFVNKAILMAFAVIGALLLLSAEKAEASEIVVLTIVEDTYGNWIDDAILIMENGSGETYFLEKEWNSDGYINSSVPTGNYTLTGYAQGFDPVVIENVSVPSAQYPSVIFTEPDSSSEVVIPDAALRAYLAGHFFGDPQSEEPITENLMKSLSFIYYSYYDSQCTQCPPAEQPIESLAGLEYAQFLKEIELYGHNISSVGPIEELSFLEFIVLERNNISTADFSQLRNLRYLYLSDNHLTAVPNLPSSIEILDLNGNNISDLSALQMQGLDRLYDVSLVDNEISDISAISGLPELEFFNASGNVITSVPELHNPSLQLLYLYGNQISDISGLASSQLPLLDEIDLGNNKLQGDDLAHLTKLSVLYWINLQYNDLNTLSGLTEHPEAALNWVHVNLSHNAITDLSPITRIHFEELDASFNQISHLPEFSGSVPIRYMDFSYNRIENFASLNNQESLYELILNGNRISDLSFVQPGDFPTLRNLSLAGNPIGDITPLVQLPYLYDLNLSETAIDGTDLSALIDVIKAEEGFPRLSYITVYGTGINEADDGETIAALDELGVYVVFDPSVFGYEVAIDGPGSTKPGQSEWFETKVYEQPDNESHWPFFRLITVYKDGLPAENSDVQVLPEGKSVPLHLSNGSAMFGDPIYGDSYYNEMPFYLEQGESPSPRLKVQFLTPGFYELKLSLLEMVLVSEDGTFYYNPVMSDTHSIVVSDQLPQVKAAYAGIDGKTVTFIFDRQLDQSFNIGKDYLTLSGTNGQVDDADFANDHTIVVALKAESGAIEWEAEASATMKAGMVRSIDGVSNPDATFTVITPSYGKQLAQNIDPAGNGVGIDGMIQYANSNNIDIHGDGIVDRYDMLYMLQLISPKLLSDPLPS